MGRTNREWFQGGLHGTKPQTSPAPLIYRQIPWDQLHSAGACLLSAKRKQKTSFSWLQRLLSQLRACATALLVACPSDHCCPSCWPLCYSHPRIPRARGPQAPISSAHSHGHRTSWTSAEPLHEPLPPFPFYLSVPADGTCPTQKEKNTAIMKRPPLQSWHHTSQRTQEPQADGSSGQGANIAAADRCTAVSPSQRATSRLHHLCCSSGRKIKVTPKSCSLFPRNLAQMHVPFQKLLQSAARAGSI